MANKAEAKARLERAKDKLLREVRDYRDGIAMDGDADDTRLLAAAEAYTDAKRAFDKE